jgi:ketosteroid isomerase-like protein
MIKNSMLNLALVMGIMVLFGSCCKEKEAAAAIVIDKEQIKSEIQAKENLYAETYNAGEMKNIGYYADDAVSYHQDGPPLVGKQAIINYLADGIDSFAKRNTISFTTQDVFPSNDGDQVVEIGRYVVVDSINVVVNSGNYMVLFEKRDGNYVSVREMSVSDIPIGEIEE